MKEENQINNKKYKYSYNSQFTWGSWDNGYVDAETLEQAKAKARQIVESTFEAVHNAAAGVDIDITIDMSGELYVEEVI